MIEADDEGRGVCLDLPRIEIRRHHDAILERRKFLLLLCVPRIDAKVFDPCPLGSRGG